MTSETDNKAEAAVERLPYRAEYGAVHHKDTEPGFVFTVSPPAFAEDVAAALNARDKLAAEVERLTAECASHGFWRIVEFFDKLGIGTGDDPIGFLLASHIHLAHQRNEARAAEAKLSALGEDARRYRRLRVLGCAVTDTPQLDAGTVVRFTGLDDLLDADLKYTPSRGEFPAEPPQEVAGLVEELRAQAQREAEAHRMVTDARFGEQYISLAKEQTAVWRAADLLTALSSSPSQGGETFQARVQPWMLACFNPEIAADKLERNDRFIEEALELVQASAYPKERAHALVEYVYGRPQGDINQEVGGVMVTLAAHCLAHGVDMHEAGEAELARINQPDIIVKIRAKQAAKPKGSALPIAESAQPQQGAADDTHKALVEALREAEATFEDIRVRLIGNLDEPERTAFWRAADGRTKVAQALAAFQSRKEESR